MEIPIINAIVQKTVYGSYTPELFYTVDSGWHRADKWISSSGEESYDQFFCVDSKDLSPVQCGGYTSQCSCCYLGFGHTENRHKQSIENYNK